mmetsp:Transcript_29759/g.28932  ORF Transcript_29759/g.28932 Transcript_29759/m.28932 type:complete len:137 (-) Transcript_29759:281-691(-)
MILSGRADGRTLREFVDGLFDNIIHGHGLLLLHHPHKLCHLTEHSSHHPLILPTLHLHTLNCLPPLSIVTLSLVLSIEDFFNDFFKDHSISSSHPSLLTHYRHCLVAWTLLHHLLSEGVCLRIVEVLLKLHFYTDV